MWMDNWVLNLPTQLWPGPVVCRFFVPSHTYVVLSSSNKAEVETRAAAIERQKVLVLRRKGGGGTVVLSPGCLVLTLAFHAKDLYANQAYFQAINTLWANALAEVGVKNIETQGISDLAVKGKKIGGTSMFRRKHLLVYQGSLLVDPDFEEMETLLQHPSREPDYRAGRSHRDFMTSTKEQGCELGANQLKSFCEKYFRQNMARHFTPHLLIKSDQ